MLINQPNPHGGDIYTSPVRVDFSANLNPCGMPPEVTQALKEAAENSSAYPDPYCRELIRNIAAYEGVDASYVLCGNGAAELIYSFCYALKPEKPALVIEPTFCEYRSALEAANVPIREYCLREEDDFTLTNDILNLDFSAYSAVFICTPNNPTGFTVHPDLLRAVAASGVRLMADVSFLDLSETPLCYDIPALLRRFPNVCILRSMTKTFAMAGVRLGYALCADTAFLESMAQKAPCWNVSTPAQRAGIAALKTKERISETAQTIRLWRDELAQQLRAYGIKVYPGETNYLLLYSPQPLAERLRKSGIMVRDCSNYVGLGEGYVRIAVRTPAENRQLLAAIKETLE